MGIAERRPGSGFAAVGVNTLDAAEVEVADSATYHYSSTGFVVWAHQHERLLCTRLETLLSIP